MVKSHRDSTEPPMCYRHFGDGGIAPTHCADEVTPSFRPMRFCHVASPAEDQPAVWRSAEVAEKAATVRNRLSARQERRVEVGRQWGGRDLERMEDNDALAQPGMRLSV